MVCLDTSFVIDFLKNNEKTVSLMKEFEDRGDFIGLASPTIIEIIRGLGTKHSSKEDEEKINNFIESMNILDLDKESAVLGGKLEIELAKKGEKIGIIDIMIASICIAHNEKLLTKNKKHFEKIKNLEIKSY